jgi:hypothetical protein
MVDQLDIALIHREAELGKHPRRSVDFVVNGNSLFELVNAKQLDMCGRFSSDLGSVQNELIQLVFQTGTPSDKSPNRIMLFVCPECGDLSCGAITFTIIRENDTVTWSDFAYENDYDDSMTDFTSFVGIGPFTFSLSDYLNVISRAINA